MKAVFLAVSLAAFSLFSISAQNLALPDATNPKMWTGQKLGLADLEIRWSSPGVKGREGKIWGTPVAHFGFVDLGFGSEKACPWRAGANEATTFSTSKDLKIEGKTLPAGRYGFFIALGEDESELIFSKDADVWGTYFYKPANDVLRVKVRQQKNVPTSRERLAFVFSDPTENAVVAALEWEKWRIPFKIEVDVKATTVASLRHEMDGGKIWDVPSLQSAANWCAANDTNLEEALKWIDFAMAPNFGGTVNFPNLSTKSELLRKLGRVSEAEKAMAEAVEKASATELHGYGRQLLGQKRAAEALVVFQKNHDKNAGAWPTNVGLARGFSANGDLKKALEHARKALEQAPDELNRTTIEGMIKKLEAGQSI